MPLAQDREGASYVIKVGKHFTKSNSIKFWEYMTTTSK